MLTKTAPPSRRVIYPLEQQELAQANRIGLRLVDALQSFFSAVNTTDRSVRAYATVLKVDRNICQRGLSTFESSRSGVEAIQKAPGVEGLRILVEAGKKHGIAARPVKQLDSTTEQLAELIGELASGSRQRLLRRIEATQAGGTDETENAGSTKAMRRRLFREAAQVAGCHCTAKFNTSILRPHPTLPDRFENVMLGAYLGYRARPGSLPLTFGAHANKERAGLDARSRPAMLDAELVDHLSSSKPVLSARECGERPMYIVDPPPGGWSKNAASVDVAVAVALEAFEDPKSFAERKLRSVRTKIRQPLERLVFTLYVHRDMLVSAVPHASVHAGMGETKPEVLGAWDTRLPDTLMLNLLGTGLQNAGSPHWGSQGEAARWLFDRVGWNPMDFVGYRLEVEFPLWVCDYIIWLDYRKPEEVDTL